MFKKNSTKKSSDYGSVNITLTLYMPKEKISLLNQYFGHSRFIWNNSLSYIKEIYEREKKSLSYTDLANRIPDLKKQEDFSFLNDVDSTLLQRSLQDLNQAMVNFYNHKAGFPRFKSKYSKQSCRVMNVVNKKKPEYDTVRIDGDKIKLGKFGWVKAKLNQKLPNGEIKYVTIKRTKTDKLFAVINIKRSKPIKRLPLTGKEVGIDIGIKHFASFSDGEVIEKPDFFLADDKKIKRLHRQLSRKQLNSKNRDKLRKKLAVAYEKDSNRRKDFTNKLSLSIVKSYDFIAAENLDIKNMFKDKRYKNLHQSIQNLGWYSFISKIKYKAEWYGKVFVQVDTFFPSSQLCNCCGYKNTKVKNLGVREWKCPICGTVHDRDNNAAINILNEGKYILVA